VLSRKKTGFRIMSSSTQSEWIERVLGFRVRSVSPNGQEDVRGAGVRLAKGMLVWNAARAHVAAEVEKLQQAILEEAADEPDFGVIKANVGRLEAVLELFDGELGKKLGVLLATTDQQEKTALLGEARKSIAAQEAALAQDPLLNGIDDNGFVKLDIRSRVMAALSTMAEVV
jgi:hypothetical protein